MNVEIANGKYTVVQDNTGRVIALRYNEPWRDCSGNKLILALAQEVEFLREKIKLAENCLVCWPIADPTEVIENTLQILEQAQE